MVELQYFGHSFFQLKDDNSTILIDPIFDSTKTEMKKQAKIPAKVDSLKKASLILVTNETPEHFDKVAVQNLALRDNAIVVGHDVVLQQLNIPRTQKASIFSNGEVNLRGVKVKSTTAHFPKSFYPLGYLVEMGGKKIYHSGVTTLHDSFEKIPSDIALLPIGSRTMDVVDAVRATKILKPKIVIPMQCDIFEQKKLDPKDFKRRIEESVLKTETVILAPGQKFKLA
jgi:L-ascorbate metabolism protein UlaG (beta-lactamase superfamily)